MKKTLTPPTVSPVLIIILVILVFLGVVLLTKTGVGVVQTGTPTPTEAVINNKNDLNRASTDLNSVNVDQQVDPSLAQLSTDTTF
jgi:hypothetical protein